MFLFSGNSEMLYGIKKLKFPGVTGIIRTVIF
jgi:hypothetical protein